MAKSAKKTPAKKKKLTLGKETVRTLSRKGPGKGGGRAAESYQTCNMKCNTDPTACKCP